MPLTRRTFLELFGIGTAVVAAPRMALPEPPAPPPAVEPQPQATVPCPMKDEVPLRPSRPTRLETFLRSRGIKPAHLARESGYSRQHLLRIRMGRMEPTPHCAISIVQATRRLSREPVGLSHLFDRAVVVATRSARRDVLREFDLLDREDVRRCFA